jgi:hypothetical protein
VLRYLLFERVARFPSRLGSGYPQQVTKLAKEGLAVGTLGSAGSGPPGDKRFSTLRRHGRQDKARAWAGASSAARKRKSSNSHFDFASERKARHSVHAGPPALRPSPSAYPWHPELRIEGALCSKPSGIVVWQWYGGGTGAV